MERQITNEQMLTEDYYTLQEPIEDWIVAGRFEILLPAYHLNHGYIKNAEDAIAKILDFKQKLEQLFPVERVDVGIAENKDIRYNCVIANIQQIFTWLDELIEFCEESTLDVFRPYEIYDFNVRIYVKFMA